MLDNNPVTSCSNGNVGLYGINLFLHILLCKFKFVLFFNKCLFLCILFSGIRRDSSRHQRFVYWARYTNGLCPKPDTPTVCVLSQIDHSVFVLGQILQRFVYYGRNTNGMCIEPETPTVCEL